MEKRIGGRGTEFMLYSPGVGDDMKLRVVSEAAGGEKSMEAGIGRRARTASDVAAIALTAFSSRRL